jgi:TrpR-related protein YerC/YecD
MSQKKPSAHLAENHFQNIRPEAEAALIQALMTLKTPDEMRRFLYDVCTPKEIADLADRWWVARLLDDGTQSYRDIHQMTGVSVTTVGRVARFLQQENFQGYRLVLDRTKPSRKG